MSDASTLAYVDSSKPVELVVDVSSHELGAILTQRDGTHVAVIACAITTVTPVEGHYSQIEREMLARAWGMECFLLYLSGANFVLLTDHKPLVSIPGILWSSPSAHIEHLSRRI